MYSKYNIKKCSEGSKYLTYELCGGLTNQRIALIQGILIAHNLNRTAVLPNMMSSFDATLSEIVPLHILYDMQYALTTIREELNMSVILQDDLRTHVPFPSRVLHANLDIKAYYPNITPSAADWSSVYNRYSTYHCATLLHTGCSFFNISMDTDMAETFWTLYDIFRPSAALNYIAKYIETETDTHVTLHVRAENDWLQHCATWESNHRDNCNTNIDVLHNTLLINDIPRDSRVLLLGGWMPDTIINNPIFTQLLQTYRVITKWDCLRLAVASLKQVLRGDVNSTIVVDGRSVAREEIRDFMRLVDGGRRGEITASEILKLREIYAAIDYQMGVDSEYFIGNSVSTFSALILLRRKRLVWKYGAALKQFHYNGGHIPLLEFIPSGRMVEREGPLKWVFTYRQPAAIASNSSNSVYDAYDYSLRVAVLSAVQNTNLQPVCLWNGPKSSTYEWLQQQGVIIIIHEPEWASKIYSIRSRLADNVYFSPLYSDPHKMVATFMRIDIPIIGFADDYILYTDVDVVFMHPIILSDFNLPPPKTFRIGAEMNGSDITHGDRKYGNAGVMLMNVKQLRKTRDKFIEFIFNDENLHQKGLHFGVYGPGDQGAYHAFYEGKFDVVKWPLWNWKPYWPLHPQIKILHFHGPKPLDYRRYLLSGTTLNKYFDQILNKTLHNGEFGCDLSVTEIDPCRSAIDIFDKIMIGGRLEQPWEAAMRKARNKTFHNIYQSQALAPFNSNRSRAHTPVITQVYDSDIAAAESNLVLITLVCLVVCVVGVVLYVTRKKRLKRSSPASSMDVDIECRGELATALRRRKQ